MTKKQVMAGFKFADKVDRQRLCQWLDDDKMGTSQKKALVIVGPRASGKSTLLGRIAKYKGEKPVRELAWRGHIVRRGSMLANHMMAKSLEECEVVLFDDAKPSSVLFREIQEIVGGFEIKIRKIRSLSEIAVYKPRASLALAFSAFASRQAERWMNGLLEYCAVVRLASRGNGGEV